MNRRHLAALALALAVLATLVWMQGCASIDPWVETPALPAQFYLWHKVDLETLRRVCAAQPGSSIWNGGGACAIGSSWSAIPPDAFRMDTDEPVGHATKGRLGIIYSNLSHTEAAWTRGAYPWEWRTLLEHEKHHLEGFVHPGWDAGREK